jgi:hypothetical protein
MTSDNSTPNRLTRLRTRTVNAVGPRAVHAAEDGLTVGLVAGLAVTFLPLAAVVVAALTGARSRAGPLALLREVGGIVRAEDARAQESYFAAGVAVGAVVGLGVGTALSVAGAGEVVTAALR